MINTKLTICACSSRGITNQKHVHKLAASARNSGYEVSIVADLCKAVQDKNSILASIPQNVVVACYPRAVNSLLAWRGVKPLYTIDIRNSSLEDACTALSLFTGAANLIGSLRDGKEQASALDLELMEEIKALPVETGTDAWYPVIDKARCTNCRKCHDFCLFGVYSVAENEVTVVNPTGCKNNCPACARVCPSKAIVFPKYDKSPINGGEAQEEDFDAETIDKMYNERLKYRLQQRRASVSLLKRNPKNDL